MKSVLVASSVILTVVIWWAALAVTQQLNDARHIEDQRAALTLGDRTITSPAVWGELFATIGDQEIERLLQQQGSRALLVEATESLLRNAILEYRTSVREEQATAGDLNDSLQALSQAFVLEMLVDFDALETAVPAIAEAFVEDLEQGELAANLEATLNQYFTSLSQDLNSQSQRQKNAIQQQLHCAQTDQCLALLTTAQNWHEQRSRLLVLGIVLALAALLLLCQFSPRMAANDSPASVATLSLLNISILALLVPGIFVPMMKLKAFIEPFTVSIGDASVYFDQQLLMYQNKSIADLVSLLLKTGQPSLFLLAAVLTLFCVLLPVGKCLAALSLLARRNKRSAQPLMRWLAVDSGKWSMADVFVIALIMAYIGMDQLISSHTDAMNTLFADAQFVQAASASELGMGFYFFLGFVGLSFWTAGKCKQQLNTGRPTALTAA